VPVWPKSIFLPDPWYLEVGESIVASLNHHTKVDGGFASVRDVSTMQLEDHQHSFFLSETWAIGFIYFLKNKK
jgi:ER degradation enhancer, mannosidase alpha-like 1